MSNTQQDTVVLTADQLSGIIHLARSAERDACLKIIDENSGVFQDQRRNSAVREVLAQRAAIIRARG